MAVVTRLKSDGWHAKGCQRKEMVIFMSGSGIIAIAAAIAIAISTLGPAIAQGLTAKAAMESIARQPDAAKDIRSTLIISLALMEALTIYGLLIAFMLIAKI